VIGISDPTKLEPVAEALAALGCRSGLVVSSTDGLDEISVSAETRVMEVGEDGVEGFSVSPGELGVEPVPFEALRAGAPERSAEIARAVLSGEKCPERSLTLLNAGAAIYVGGKSGSIADGVLKAAQAIDSGAASDVLERYVKRTRELSPA
jgi:anthranilate phosphoribosyltransferase